MNVHLAQSMSLPMYALPKMEEANSAFLAALLTRLRTKNFDTEKASVDCGHGAGLTGDQSGVLFTQMCGYPLFKHYRRQYNIIATPHYALPGCVGSTHRAFFMVRTDDPATCLDDLRGSVFGCNSLLSNTGMNLPRLSLARIAGGRSIFSSVVITGAHVTSLQYLAKRTVDICAVDNVTWGLFTKFYPAASAQYRILEETASSPCLPFVTSLDTATSQFVQLREALYAVMNDPLLRVVREVLGLAGLSNPDVDTYERLAQYECEAAKLGYPEIR
jgi:ABC-type phosphate/phosphonate transport system substrate-binding protein